MKGSMSHSGLARISSQARVKPVTFTLTVILLFTLAGVKPVTFTLTVILLLTTAGVEPMTLTSMVILLLTTAGVKHVTFNLMVILLLTKTVKSLGALSISPDGARDLGMCSRVNPLGIMVVEVCITMYP